MSSELEMSPPAAPIASHGFHASGASPSGVGLWGVATFVVRGSADVLVTVRSMPSGSRIRACTNSAHGWPETARITSPAAMNMRFE